MLCEAWQTYRPHDGHVGEEACDHTMPPPSAEAGEYCIADSSGLRTLCNNVVYRVLPYMLEVKSPEKVCKQCTRQSKIWWILRNKNKK